MNDPVVEAKDVTKVLGSGAGEVQAVKNVSLSLRAGEVVLLMGPSGSGKTTLLSVLGGMLTPTSGTVEIRGVSTAGADPEKLAGLRRQHMGFVFQTYHLFPTLTAAENVQLALDMRGIRGREASERTRDALEQVGLTHKLRSFPLELSGGEQQRVAIARAIVGHPSAVLADEPTAALDGDNGQRIMSTLSSIAHDHGRTVLVVTHDSRLTSFADRIIFIEDGRLVGERRTEADTPKLLATVGP